MNYRQKIENYIRQEALPVDKFGHQPRLYALSRQVGAGSDYDDDVVHAAVWLHDLGVFYGHRPADLEALVRWDSVKYAMDQAPAVLTEFGFPVGKIGAVVEAIRTHQPTFEPTSIEGLILRDADILEQLGAIAVLRTVSKVGRDTRFQRFTDAVENLRKMVRTLPSLLRMDSAKQLAKPKIEFLESFLLAAEAEGHGFLE